MTGQATLPGQRLPWDACLNARDLGGYGTSTGNVTRWGAIVRADNLSRLTPAGQQALVDYGVRTIIDLRNPREVAIAAHPFASRAGDGPTYRHIAFEESPAAIDVTATARQIYRWLLGRNQQRIGTIMRAIADAPEGGVLVHCHAGKDRTGLIAALLLALVEVAPSTIAEDYALSTVYGQAQMDAWLAEIADPIRREQERQRWDTPVPTMLTTIDDLDADHGGARAYLRAAGVDDAGLNRLRARLLDSP